MRRGLHLLGYDWMKSTSAMTAALAEGLAKGAPGQRADGNSIPTPPTPPPEKSNTAWWYIGGAAAFAVAGALLWRSR